ncbi:M20 family metallopeptidase [Sulfodiicoccus acidiphilus]|nr:M20/M25/M40 family metallo-hydrolase [Sulfodiicoccus acidiphilus]
MKVELEDVINRIDRQELVKVTTEMVNIPSPTGHEKEMGEYVADKMRELGLKVIWQEVEEGRPNVIGILKGEGGGPTLQFDGHLDVSFTGAEEFMRGGATTSKARVEEIENDQWIFGAGSFNMKSALAAYLITAKALVDSGRRLRGDLVISATSGEIESSQVDEFVGREYRGYGTGARYASSHGLLSDFVVLGEPTGLKIMIGHFGSFWVKLSLTGGTVIHTAWSRDVENKIEQLPKVIETLKKWRKEFEEKTNYKGYKGIVNVAAVKGGRPWKAARTPDSVSLYLDIRFPPNWTPLDVKEEVDQLVTKLNAEDPRLKLESTPYAINVPTEVSEDEYIVRSLVQSHKKVFGTEPELTYELWYSNAPNFNALGAKAVNYGPSGAKRLPSLGLSDKDREYISVSDLHNCTKVYVLTSLDILSKTREEVRRK